MRLKDLHEESIRDAIARWTPKKMSEPEIVAWCKSNASRFLSQKSPIYRGTEENLTGLLNTTNLNRTSANSNNFYNWWIDNNSSWKKFPKRSSSIICSADAETASEFGNSYLIIPADNCNIGICPAPDMWGSFSIIKEFENISDLNDFVRALGELWVGDKYPKNWNDLKSRLKETTVEMLEKSDRPFPKELAKFMKEHYADNAYDFLDEDVFDPNFNKFEVKTAANFNLSKDREVWISGEVMQIEINEMNDDVIEFLQTFYTDEQLDISWRD